MVPERSEAVEAFALGWPYPRVEAVGAAAAEGRAALALDVVVGRAVLAFAERFTLLTLFTLLVFLERSTLTFILLYWGAFTVVLGA